MLYHIMIGGKTDSLGKGERSRYVHLPGWSCRTAKPARELLGDLKAIPLARG